jgi:hypothetical protein
MTRIESIILKMAEEIANRENDDCGNCGPYGTDTAADHMDYARDIVQEIIDAHEQDKINPET